MSSYLSQIRCSDHDRFDGCKLQSLLAQSARPDPGLSEELLTPAEIRLIPKIRVLAQNQLAQSLASPLRQPDIPLSVESTDSLPVAAHA